MCLITDRRLSGIAYFAVVVAASSLALLSGCEVRGSCLARESVVCTCADGHMGAQVCANDGSRFGVCECVFDGGAGLDAGPEPPDLAAPDSAVTDGGEASDMGGTADAGLCGSDDDCSDGRLCDGIERCSAGRCVPGSPLICDDGVVCTADACTEPDGCSHTRSDAACSDGLTCNGVETCGATGCTEGTPIDCGDGVACTVDSCAEPGTCSHTRNDSACSDGLTCNGAEACGATGCEPGTAVDCGDGVTCTTDTCAEPSGVCGHAFNDTSCAGGRCTARGCCSDFPCSTWPVCGCGVGEGCFPGAGCMAAAGGTAGSSCSYLNGCAPGFICMSTNLCKQFCVTDADCGGGSLCGALGGGGRVCTNICDPVAAGACGGGTNACHAIFQGGTVWYSECFSAGTGGVGATCTWDEDCAAQLSCSGSGGVFTCGRTCVLSTGAGCVAGETCLGYAPAALIGGVEYGVCR